MLLRRDKYVLYSLWGTRVERKVFPLVGTIRRLQTSDWKQLSENLSARKARHLMRQLWLMFDSSAAGWPYWQ